MTEIIIHGDGVVMLAVLFLFLNAKNADERHWMNDNAMTTQKHSNLLNDKINVARNTLNVLQFDARCDNFVMYVNVNLLIK